MNSLRDEAEKTMTENYQRTLIVSFEKDFTKRNLTLSIA